MKKLLKGILRQSENMQCNYHLYGCEVLWSACRYVCFLVCLSVRSLISKTTHPNFTKFSAHVTCGHDGNAICYVFPVLWMTSCFHIMGAFFFSRRDYTGATRDDLDEFNLVWR